MTWHTANNAKTAPAAESSGVCVELSSSQPPEAATATPAAVDVHSHSFLTKLRGTGRHLMPSRRTALEAICDGFFAWVGIAVLALLHTLCVRHSLLQLVASFGASAVLVFGVPSSPLAQPRNLVFGNLVSAFCGVAVAKIFRGTLQWLASALAVGTAVLFMGLLGVTHPPSGATALIAVIGGPSVEEEGWLYIVQPILTGSLILLVTALLCNNLHRRRSYPTYW
jgi:CBS-domain-containing membrane protein